MIIFAWFGGIIVLAIAGAAIYDHRTRRRGWTPGPTGITQKLLSVDGGGSGFGKPDPLGAIPGSQGDIADSMDDERGDHRPSDQ
jgi:hypothetical protein